MYQVLFYSRGGNTRKLANVIAEELGVTAADVRSAALEPGPGVLFLGSGCYGGKPGKEMLDFIGKNDLTGRKVALFGTSGGGIGNEVKAMADALKIKGASVVGSYYSKGKFLVFSMGHPDRDELEGAKRFAREMARSS